MVERKARAFVLLCAAAAIGAEAQTYTRLASVAGFNGSNPAILVQGVDGNFYGVTSTGGAGSSVIFKMIPSGTLSEFYSFDELSGADSLIAGKNGDLYGLSYGDGNPFISTPGVDIIGNEGTVFQLTPQGSLTRIFLFSGTGQGGTNELSLSLGSDGNFYGTSQFGGSNVTDPLLGAGNVFKVTPAGTETVLYNFSGNGSDGTGANSVILASDGNLYGTTVAGGSGSCHLKSVGGTVLSNGCGTIFKIISGSSFETIYNFTGAPDGAFPETPLVEGPDGNLYGTASALGPNGNGTVFKITRNGALTTLHAFNGMDGSAAAALTPGQDGNFYGTTSSGGSAQAGTIFEITPAGTLTTLYNFCMTANCADGASGRGIIQASDGNLYGVTYAGGAFGTGAVFKLAIASPPAIAENGVVNGASFNSTGITGGEIASLFGTNVTSSTGINLTSGLPLPTQFLKVSVLVNGTPAPIFAVDNVNGQNQINFQVPWEVAPESNASIAVMNNGATSATVMVPVLAAQPGIINYSSGGQTFGVIVHADYQLADTGHPASPGEVMLIYCTGLGAVSSTPADGAAGSGQTTIAQPTVTIGGQKGTVQFSGLAPGFVGLNQVNVQLPASLQSGNQAVVIEIGGASSNSVLLPVK
jgi:uncharacterized protein (TIGR03437 family)